MNNEAIKKIAENNGYGTASRMVMEECSELIIAINKMWRCGDDFDNLPVKRKAIIEELGDVEIMITQLKYLMNCEKEVDHIIEQKLTRQLERINNGLE